MSRKIFKSGQINMSIPYEIGHQEFIENRGSESQVDLENKPEGYYDIKKHTQMIIDRSKDEGATIISEANYEAARIINESKLKAENAKKDGFNEGYKEGCMKGEKEGKYEYEKLLEEVELQKQRILIDYEATLLEAEEEIVSLAVAIAKKIVQEELKLGSHVIVALVRDALSKTLEKKGITVEVSPDDYEGASESIKLIAAKEFTISEMEVKQNSGLESGDVLIHTSFGTINGSASEKLDKVSEAFEEL